MSPSSLKPSLQPLSGIRVLDLTRLLPGPWSTMLLADLGAEVVKVESPEGGDGSRHATPRYADADAGESVYFCNVNRNKRSIVLDLKSAHGHAAFCGLARDADVVVENFRPGGAERLGIGYAQLRELNARLVYCALTGYGQDGAMASLAGHDLNIAGMSGLLQRDEAQAPAMPNVLMGDYAGATMVVIGVLSALVDRERHGRGAFIDVSMLDALMSWTSVHMTRPFARAVDARTTGGVEGWGGNPRYGIYRTRDGRYLTVSLLEKKYWDAFCRLYGREDLVNAHETEADRLTSHRERGEAYRTFLAELFATRDRDEWVDELQGHGLPVCPVLTPDEAFHAPQARQRGHFLDMPVARLGGPIPQMGFPFRMTSSDGADAFALRHPPPALGEANHQYTLDAGRQDTHVDVR